MLNSEKKNCASRDKKDILTLVLSEKKFLNETKNHNPPPGPPVSSTNKTDRHDITQILLKVALNTIIPNQTKLRIGNLTTTRRRYSVVCVFGSESILDLYVILTEFYQP
jgi:hypothetical protein